MLRAKSMAVVGMGALVLSAIALPASAGDSEWKVRFGVLFNSPTGDLSESGQTTELDNATGFHVSGEFGVTERIGIEPGLGYAKHDIDVKESGFPTLGFGETTWTALTVNGNYHLFQEGSVDLYVGPTVGYVFWDSIESNVFLSDVPTDDEFTFGVNAGIDVPIGDSPWAFAGALRYLSVDLGVPGGSDIGVDPIQIKIGLSYSF
jgi:outer membrane protein W